MAMSSRMARVNEENLILKSLQVLFRHGARTPLKPLPGIDEVKYDKNILLPLSHMDFTTHTVAMDGSSVTHLPLEKNNEGIHFKGGAQAGQLTDFGKMQCYRLGLQLGEKYRRIFTHSFDPSVIWMRTSPLKRCIESLKCVLAGIFSENLESLALIPLIPADNILVRVDLSKTKMYPQIFNCPQYKDVSQVMYEHMVKDPDYDLLVKRLKKDFSDMMDNPGVDMSLIYDHMCARKEHGLFIPEKLLEVSSHLEKFATEYLLINSGGRYNQTKSGLSLSMGRLANTLAKNFEAVSKRTHNDKHKQPSVFLFSGHDSTLAPLLEILGYSVRKHPRFASSITLELFEDDRNEHWVQVNYDNKPLVLRGCCQPIIPLEEFLTVLGPFRINYEDYITLCQSSEI